MPDREKVIKELEMSYKYSNVDENNTLVPQWVVRDALALLKAQEPRLVTEDDFMNADKYGWLPAWCEERLSGDVYCECMPNAALEEKGVRYWTACPTDDHREAVKWE